ncbi:hypothetical protein C8J56DRAFT_1053531 [Mycena floridula]|nr:hypothetical protein C8J56DRAFT_1053531 [Mycena floridula]
MFNVKLISLCLALLATGRASFAAPVLVPRTGNGCYVIFSPNPNTDMIVGNTPGGNYKLHIKFGDGGDPNARDPNARDNAYATHNPDHLCIFPLVVFYAALMRAHSISHAEDATSMSKCGHLTQFYGLEKLLKNKNNAGKIFHNKKPASTADLLDPKGKPITHTEWWTLMLGTSVIEARIKLKKVFTETKTFGAQTFTDEKGVKDWAETWANNIESSLVAG